VQKSLAKAAAKADEAADETVSQQKKPIDVEQKNDLFVLVGIGREILFVLKCIIGLVCLVLLGIVYIVSRLE
jgi:predicted flap endonuclease-1-like 5' DNA nuclease